MVRDVVLAWRRLIGASSGKTVVACSGGADSVALLLALRSVTRDLVVAWIRHPMRPVEVVATEGERVRVLADALGLDFETDSVALEGGNVEARAREARYEALASIARETDAAWVATGHHADDQLESMIMGLLRGAGPAGLAGAAPRRTLAPGVTLIRPLLGISRTDAERLCADAGWVPCEDTTNADRSRLRAALRHGPLRELATIRPDGPRRAARSAALMWELSELVEEAGAALVGDAVTWNRSYLRSAREVVVAAGLRQAAARLLDGRGRDGLGGRQLDPVIRAIKDHVTDPRVFEWTLGLRVRVTVSRVGLYLKGEA